MKNIVDRLYEDSPLEELPDVLSVSLADFVQRVDGMRFQFVEEWCLCDYYSQYGKGNDRFSYRLNLLRIYINNIRRLNVEGGSKKAILQRMLVDDYDYADPKMICRIIVDIFNHENIVDSEVVNKVSEDFAKSIQSLIDVISTSSQVWNGEEFKQEWLKMIDELYDKDK